VPNPSLNHRTRYGGPSWPGLGYAVHFPNPGQANVRPLAYSHMYSPPRTHLFLLALLAASASNAGPYWLWQGEQYQMFAGDLLYDSVDPAAAGGTPTTRSIHKVAISKSGTRLKDEQAVCFVHLHRDEPALMYCEPGHPDALSGGVWRRSRGSTHFQCITGCGAKVPNRFQAALN